MILIMNRIIRFLLVMACFLPGWAVAQTTIRGTVIDKNGPVSGASVLEKGVPGNGTITNTQGQFTLLLKGTSNVLQVSSVGYLPREVLVSPGQTVTVILEEDISGLEEVIVVGFGSTKKITNTGAVSTISASEVRTVPTPNIQNTLAGRVPGFFSQQRSGQPGMSGAQFFIRGVNTLGGAAAQAPLIIVDDVEYNIDQVAQLDVNEIESFTVLKDASTTAVYGVKGANGVLVITTKRGRSGRPKINFTTESGLQAPFRRFEFLNAYQVATLRNEALRNDNLAEEFTEEDLELFRTGEDPYGHPDVDWYNEIVKRNAYQTRNNFDVSGGSDRVRYFVSGGYVYQNGMLKNFSKGTGQPDNNYAYQRYNFRSNLDFQATKDFSLRMDVTGRLGTIVEPHIATAPLSTIYSFQRLPPYAAPLMNPDGSYPWALNSRYRETSLIGRLALQGYDRTYRNELNLLLGAEHKLDFVTKGLSLKSRVAFSGDMRYGRSLSRNNIPAFHYNPETGVYTPHDNGLYRLEPLTRSVPTNSSISKRTTNVQAILGYDRTFGAHHVHGLALYNQNQYINTDGNLELAPFNFRGYSFRAGYDYKQRYLIEMNAAYNGSDRFVKENRYGWFPAISAGWNIAEEPFFKEYVRFADLVKLRGSFGLVGSDVVDNDTYVFEQIYESSTTAYNYSFGESHNTFTSIQEGTLANLQITWEKARKANIGVDLRLLGGKMNVTADYFYDVRYDQLITRESALNIIGVGLPKVNLGRTENKGVDGTVGFNGTSNQFSYMTSFTFSIARNKILYIDEAASRYPWLARTGLPIGMPLGYNVLGFFQSQEEVDNYAHLQDARPGDLKYEDLNGDGVIDQFDQRIFGKPNLPQKVLGTTLGFGYKGFSMNVLFQGSFDYSYRVATAGVIPFQGNLQPLHLNRWTPETAATATYPRLSTVLAGPSSPSIVSNFWYINGKYVRLKSADVGYSLSPRLASALRLSSARIYASGYDLLTWSNFNLYQHDPEIASGGSAGTYPVQKIYTVGIQIGL